MKQVLILVLALALAIHLALVTGHTGHGLLLAAFGPLLLGAFVPVREWGR